MLNRYLKFIFTVLPFLLLMIASTYFAYTNWQKYQKSTSLNNQLNNTKLLQSVEHSVLNEIVCVATMSHHKDLMEKVCNPTRKTTDNLVKQILAQDDRELYILEKIIFNIRNSIENSGTVAVEKLVNGELDKNMHAYIQKYTKRLNNYSNDMDKKEYLRFYADISNISYETESEKALVSYYLTLKKPIPSFNLIYWDKTVSKSEIYNLNSNKISILHEDIDSIWKQDTFQTTLRGIEDIRLDIMSHANDGQYKSNVATWVALLNKKQKILLQVESMLLGHILEDVSKELSISLFILLLSIVGLISALIGLYFFIGSWRKDAEKKKLFTELLNRISSEHGENAKVKLNDDIKSYKIACDYLDSSYESLSVKGKNIDTENKVNTAFLNNLAYEIRTPLNGISGYTKLLKETPLNVEQSDFVSLIENSFENLDSILNKISNDTVLTSQKLEVENYSFDIVKKVEATVETFAIKSDQKDIVLGLYIDPTLPQKIKGDATKLSQIMTNLIDNALESSSAYNTIDITVEKLYNDEDQISIKFSIVDEGIGYNEDEVKKITEAFETIETIDNIATINMKNLSISNKIIKRMGGKLEIESRKGEGSNFFFTLSFENDSKQLNTVVYPTFKGMKIGLALPSKDINRQVDKNLEKYIEYLGAEFIIYDYETLFDSNSDVILPELMCVYHNYMRLEGEIASFSNLDCKVALITSGTLRSRIDTNKYNFSSIVYAPITMRKIIKIIAESRIDNAPIIEEVLEKEESHRKFDDVKALIVEDNDISKKIISNILEKFDVDVTTASDGVKAFELRRESDFDIIFMDIEMPIMNGIEATSKILYYEGVNQFQHVPIIALTADASGEHKEKYKKAGMDDCIEKPIDAEVVYDMVNKYAVERKKELAQSEEDELIAKVLAGDFLKE